MKYIGWRERVFKTTRGKIVHLLRIRQYTVNELAAELDLTDNAVRAHLAGLERALVLSRLSQQFLPV